MHFEASYQAVINLCESTFAEDWAEFREFVRPYILDRPETGLVLAGCNAVGGDLVNAVPVAAAVAFANAGMDIMDELADEPTDSTESPRDRARYWNMALAAHVSGLDLLRQSELPGSIRNRVFNAFFESYFPLIRGFDLDIKGQFSKLEDYWRVLELRMGARFGTAAACGALAGTDHSPSIRAAGICGHHFGLALYIIRNHQDVFLPSDSYRPHRNELALPLLFGLKMDHPRCKELKLLIAQQALENSRETVVDYLKEMNAGQFLKLAAEKEKAKAIDALADFQDAPGMDAFRSFVIESLHLIP
jgi:geranylgeranyl pyrophosphate synthase